ncbi:MAG TPA: dihydroorotase [Candidatus Coatesbacteria bacterium]|nr:dihydroorotase [Candidatus Coatesbacteria bacterium]
MNRSARPLLLKGGTVVDPARGLFAKADVLLRDGVVAAVERGLALTTAEVIDCRGLFVVPGLVDMHVHLREPGLEDKETIVSGTRAAARGGFTSIACKANTGQFVDNEAAVEYVRAIAELRGLVNVFPIAALTAGLASEGLAPLHELREAGAVALSDDGHPVRRAGLLLNALKYARDVGFLVISHAEDTALSGEGVFSAGPWSTAAGLEPIHAEAEEVGTARDILVAARADVPLHVDHVSTARSVESVRDAKRRDFDVSAEATPHHFCLDQSMLESPFDPNTKVNPPIRGAADRKAVIAGLRDGTLEIIASDHAPHTEAEKSQPYQHAPFGIVGLETTLGLTLTHLVEPGHLSFGEAVEKLSTNPARRLGLAGRGTLFPGSAADVTVVDRTRRWTVDPKSFASKGVNTPFSGWKLVGRAACTIVGGRLVMADGELVEG